MRKNDTNKIYVHKHVVFDLKFWDVISEYLEEKQINNFSEFLKSAIMFKINHS
ncbi:MAG: hypothetical protein LUH05_04090 [Candidatus Gastranaerophilales bacterium]|nr:hypothetical protein [Candidatus Gastranaerophilales bacterium]